MCIISVFFFQMFSQNVSPKEGRHIAFVTFQHHAFSNVSSNDLSVKMHSHIGCIWKAFLRCAFSNVSSYCLQGKTHNHIGCICLTFLQCAFSNVSLNCFYKKRHNYIGAICLAFFHCVFLNVASKHLHEWMQKSHWLHLFDFSPMCVSNVSSNCFYKKRHNYIGGICLAFFRCAFVWLFSIVCF